MSTGVRPYRGGRVAEQPPPDDDGADRGRCIAYGCTERGCVDHGNSGRFACSAHAWVPADRWQAVTQALHQHAWLIDHIRGLRSDGQYRTWRDHAVAFWRDAEPSMVPDPRETRELYLYRLHLELMHRVGARDKKPVVMVPQGQALRAKALDLEAA